MIKKNVTYYQYQILKAIYANVKVLKANDNSATIVISKIAYTNRTEEVMAMKYFNNVNTLEKLRKQYRDLLKKHHPDNGGNVSDMQIINAEYDRLFKVLKDKHKSKSMGKDNKTTTDYNSMKYDFSEDAKLREMLSKIISFDGITIEVCGAWIWAFDSYNYRKELKELGFRYARNKRAWYWHSESFRKRSHKTLSMDDIRNYYGSTEVETDGTKRLKQA